MKMAWLGNSLVMHSAVIGGKSSITPPLHVITLMVFAAGSDDENLFSSHGPLKTQLPIDALFLFLVC